MTLSVGFIETFPDSNGDVASADDVQFVTDTLGATQFCRRMGWTFEGWDDQEHGIALIEIHTLEENNANEIHFDITMTVGGRTISCSCEQP